MFITHIFSKFYCGSVPVCTYPFCQNSIITFSEERVCKEVLQWAIAAVKRKKMLSRHDNANKTFCNVFIITKPPLKRNHVKVKEQQFGRTYYAIVVCTPT